MTREHLAATVLATMQDAGISQWKAAAETGYDVAAVNRALHANGSTPALLALANRYVGPGHTRIVREHFVRRAPDGRFVPPTEKDTEG